MFNLIKEKEMLESDLGWELISVRYAVTKLKFLSREKELWSATENQ
jgi:hypothetical protein